MAKQVYAPADCPLNVVVQSDCLNPLYVKSCDERVRDWEVTCISNDGGQTIVSGVVVYNMVDPQDPTETIYLNGVDVTGDYVKVPCEKNIDNETVDICRVITTTGVWGSEGDQITITRIFDTTTTPATYLTSIITNVTTGQDITAIVDEATLLTNSDECNIDGECMVDVVNVEKKYDVHNGQGYPVHVVTGQQRRADLRLSPLPPLVTPTNPDEAYGYPDGESAIPFLDGGGGRGINTNVLAFDLSGIDPCARVEKITIRVYAGWLGSAPIPTTDGIFVMLQDDTQSFAPSSINVGGTGSPPGPGDTPPWSLLGASDPSHVVDAGQAIAGGSGYIEIEYTGITLAQLMAGGVAFCFDNEFDNPTLDAVVMRLDLDLSACPITEMCQEIEKIEFYNHCTNELTWDYYICSNDTNAAGEKIKERYIPIGEVRDECTECEIDVVSTEKKYDLIPDAPLSDSIQVVSGSQWNPALRLADNSGNIANLIDSTNAYGLPDGQDAIADAEGTPGAPNTGLNTNVLQFDLSDIDDCAEIEKITVRVYAGWEGASPPVAYDGLYVMLQDATQSIAPSNINVGATGTPPNSPAPWLGASDPSHVVDGGQLIAGGSEYMEIEYTGVTKAQLAAGGLAFAFDNEWFIRTGFPNFALDYQAPRIDAVVMRLDLDVSGCPTGDRCIEIEKIQFYNHCTGEFTRDYYRCVEDLNADGDKVKEKYTPLGEVYNECPLCVQSTTTSYADNISIIPFNHFSVINNACCDVLITTDLGTNIVPAGLTYSSPEFKCDIENITVEFIDPADPSIQCDLSDVLVTLNNL